MANTKKYLSHLLQNTGITPACSEEERAAADVIAKIFSDHGFAPEVQEFSASGSAKVVQAGLGIAVFVGAVLAGIGRLPALWACCSLSPQRFSSSSSAPVALFFPTSVPAV